MQRRTFLATSALTLGSAPLIQAASTAFQLDPLPYAPDALEPHIDARTMEIHHGLHHKTYVTKLNEALAKAPPGLPTALKELIQQVPGGTVGDAAFRTAVRHHGGGHFNHTLFWKTLGKPGSPAVGGEPTGAVAAKITEAFGSFAKMQAAVIAAGLKQFGSGWAWVSLGSDGRLKVTSTANQDNPLMKGIVPDAELGTPLFGIDVWEHAYYLKYQNRRGDFLTAFWNVLNWAAVEENLKQVR